MHPSMAFRAKGDEILHRVAAELTARLYVMDLEIFPAPAILAAPAITL